MRPFVTVTIPKAEHAYLVDMLHRACNDHKVTTLREYGTFGLEHLTNLLIRVQSDDSERDTHQDEIDDAANNHGQRA